MKKYCFCVLVAAVALQSCDAEKKDVAEKKEAFALTDTMLAKMEFDVVQERTLLSELKLSGKITANEDKVAKVFPRVDGHIVKLNVQLGDYVSAGQTLAIIKSRQIADLDNDLNSAVSNIQILKKNLDVAEELFKSGLGAEKEVVTARQELQKGESELRRVRETLKVYDVGKETTYLLKSPISGFVVEKNAVEQMDFNIENIDHFFTISNMTDVWVIADVYETDMNKVKLGYECNITTLADPDRILKGRIDKIFNVLDPESRVMKVRVRLPNPNFALKPQMFASVMVHHEEAGKMLAIPSQAVIFDKSKQWVMVYKDRKNIETRQVTILKTIGDWSYISAGLKVGEKIITKQQLLVYDALND